VIQCVRAVHGPPPSTRFHWAAGLFAGQAEKADRVRCPNAKQSCSRLFEIATSSSPLVSTMLPVTEKLMVSSFFAQNQPQILHGALRAEAPVFTTLVPSARHARSPIASSITTVPSTTPVVSLTLTPVWRSATAPSAIISLMGTSSMQN
jgi:hypothetical protein